MRLSNHIQECFKQFGNYVAAPVSAVSVHQLLYRAIGLIYIVAALPLVWQIVPISGTNGLMPAQGLLAAAQAQEGYGAMLHFPSLFWLWRSDVFLKALPVVCAAAGAFMLLGVRYYRLWAFLAWASFVSVCTVGGDFTVIIIDLFLAEAGFLVLLASAPLEKGYVPRVIDFAFKLLNFRLWFSMGMVKFYWGLDNTWGHLNFFENFFPFQPIPTPGAWWLWHSSAWLHTLAIAGVFIGQMIVPFAAWFGRKGRLLAFFAYLAMSLLIVVSGNYGYFNWLSVVLVITVLKDGDIRWLAGRIVTQNVRPMYGTSAVALCLVSVQFIYLLFLFDRNPPHTQNHFNYPFLYEGAKRLPFGLKQLNNYILKPIAWMRLCNPYGVFKDIPHYRAELRFLGSADGKDWKPVVWKYHPSAINNGLRWVAPYYPRLDHLLFYESIDAGNYRFNPLNPYSTPGNVWTCNFIQQLKQDKAGLQSLLSSVPTFAGKPPRYIKADVYSLQFNRQHPVWDAAFVKTIYNDFDSTTTCACRPLMAGERPLVPY